MFLSKSCWSQFVVIACTIFLLSCNTSENILTPDQIGSKKRSNLILGEDAIKDIDKLHGLAVAAQSNVIAEYGEDERDLLYLSFYQNKIDANKAFFEMVKKIAHNKKSPFSHLTPIAGAERNGFFLLGMGAAHYVYLSGHHIIWLQTYQSFDLEIPISLSELFPVDSGSDKRLLEES